MIDAKKRLKNIEDHVLPSLFVGVLSQSDAWMKKTTEKYSLNLKPKRCGLQNNAKKKVNVRLTTLYVTKIGSEHYSEKHVKN